MKARQSRLENLLGTTHEQFTRSYMLGTDTVLAFVTSTADSRSKLLQDILGLSAFDLYLDFAKSAKSPVNPEHGAQGGKKESARDKRICPLTLASSFSSSSSLSLSKKKKAEQAA